MTTLPCPECGRDSPDSAPACVVCGRPRKAVEPDPELDALLRSGERIRAMQYLMERKGFALPGATRLALERERELGVTPS